MHIQIFIYTWEPPQTNPTKTVRSDKPKCLHTELNKKAIVGNEQKQMGRPKRESYFKKFYCADSRPQLPISGAKNVSLLLMQRNSPQRGCTSCCQKGTGSQRGAVAPSLRNAGLLPGGGRGSQEGREAVLAGPSLHLLLFRRVKLKIIFMPKQQIWGQHILPSFSEVFKMLAHFTAVSYISFGGSTDIGPSLVGH